MPPSPRTPLHSRNSSALETFQDSPRVRRQSKTSLHDSMSAPFINNLSHQDSLDLSILASGGAGSGEGMGNLADELADAFSESGEEEIDEYQDGDFALTDSRAPPTQRLAIEAIRDSGVHVDGETIGEGIHAVEGGLGIPTLPKRGHQRKGSEYDGSEYGSESDLDSAGMPPTLVAKIDAIESLARRGTENYGGPADDVFRRVTDGLRDLGSQSTVEGSASRSEGPPPNALVATLTPASG